MPRPPPEVGAGGPSRDDAGPLSTWGPAVLLAPGGEGLDLDEELAIHEEIKRRRVDPPDLDPGTEAILRRNRYKDTHDNVA